MARITYKIDFFTYWHTGSGLSAGTNTNLVVIKNKKDLPFIPGKTLKGILREAACQIQHLSGDKLVKTDFIKQIFGIGDDDTRTSTNAGVAFFGNAELSTVLSENIAKAQKSLLYHTITSTAIGKEGQAIDNTLRSIEVSVPLTLYAQIDDFPDNADFNKQLERCFQWARKIGMNRNRGLGRCQFTKI